MLATGSEADSSSCETAEHTERKLRELVSRGQTTKYGCSQTEVEKLGDVNFTVCNLNVVGKFSAYD